MICKAILRMDLYKSHAIVLKWYLTSVCLAFGWEAGCMPTVWHIYHHNAMLASHTYSPVPPLCKWDIRLLYCYQMQQCCQPLLWRVLHTFVHVTSKIQSLVLVYISPMMIFCHQNFLWVCNFNLFWVPRIVCCLVCYCNPWTVSYSLSWNFNLHNLHHIKHGRTCNIYCGTTWAHYKQEIVSFNVYREYVKWQCPWPWNISHLFNWSW